MYTHIYMKQQGRFYLLTVADFTYTIFDVTLQSLQKSDIMLQDSFHLCTICIISGFNPVDLIQDLICLGQQQEVVNT